MIVRRKLAIGAASLAGLAAVAVPMGITSGGGTVDVFVGSTPTPTSTPSGAPTTGNLWIQPGAGTCAGGRSSSAISLAAAASPDRICGSIPQAYSAANAGDTICFGSGTYTASGITNGDASSQLELTSKASATDVVLDGCQSSGIDMSAVELDFRLGDNITVSNLAFRSFYLRGCASDMTFDGITAKGSIIRGADRIVLKNSTMGFGTEVSFWTARTNSATGCAQDNNDPADDITISNVRWGDVWSTTSADHTDSIAIDYVTNLNIDRLEMTGCENACLIFGNGTGLSRGASDISITNSVFVCCYDAFQCGGSWCNEPGGNNVVFFMDADPGPVYFAFNSVSSQNGGFKLTDGSGTDPRGSDFVLDSNVFDSDISASCSRGSWVNNVSATTACSGTNKVAAPGWVDAPVTCCTLNYGWDGTYDLDLTGSPGAQNYGNQSVFPATDIDGVTRSAGTVDAGAYER